MREIKDFVLVTPDQRVLCNYYNTKKSSVIKSIEYRYSRRWKRIEELGYRIVPA